MCDRHGASAVQLRGSLQKSKVSAVYPSAASILSGLLERTFFLCWVKTSILAVIFAEHVLSSELYLVLAGKFKSTFDLFVIDLVCAYTCYMVWDFRSVTLKNTEVQHKVSTWRWFISSITPNLRVYKWVRTVSWA